LYWVPIKSDIWRPPGGLIALLWGAMAGGCPLRNNFFQMHYYLCCFGMFCYLGTKSHTILYQILKSNVLGVVGWLCGDGAVRTCAGVVQELCRGCTPLLLDTLLFRYVIVD
jgi:hypothetical protein